MANVLVCDDERDIVSALKIYLSGEGHEVIAAYDGQEALDILRDQKVDLVLLDVMMPVMDGIETMSEIRKFSNVPIIMLTAKSEDADKVLGLNLGADDYVTKPFNPIELLARVKSQLRRYTTLGAAEKKPDTLSIGGIVLDDVAKRILLDGDEISLTPTEFSILKLFMENPGRVFSPRDIYEEIWRGASEGSENTVAVHIRHLREKIEIDPANPRYIKVIWGQGYKLEAR